MNSLPPHLEYCDELARYIERASCAVAVLGDLLEAIPEEDLNDGAAQSLGFLLKILGDGMMQRSLESYAFIRRSLDAMPKNNATQPAEEKLA